MPNFKPNTQKTFYSDWSMALIYKHKATNSYYLPYNCARNNQVNFINTTITNTLGLFKLPTNTNSNRRNFN